MTERNIRALLGWGLICGQLTCIGLALCLASWDRLDVEHGELTATNSAIMPLHGVHVVPVIKRFLNQTASEADVQVAPERFFVALAMPSLLVSSIIGVLFYKGYGPAWRFSDYIWTFGLLQTLLGTSVAIIVEAIFPQNPKKALRGKRPGTAGPTES
jgi:hypothetical protein